MTSQCFCWSLTSDEPAHEEDSDHAVTHYAWRVMLALTVEKQEEHGSKSTQINGDEGLPWTFMYKHYSCWTQR